MFFIYWIYVFQVIHIFSEYITLINNQCSSVVSLRERNRAFGYSVSPLWFSNCPYLGNSWHTSKEYSAPSGGEYSCTASSGKRNQAKVQLLSFFFIYIKVPIEMITYRRRKSFLSHLNSSKQRSGSSTRCFWSGVRKRGTHFENNLRIPKDSYKIVDILPSDILRFQLSHATLIYDSPKLLCGILLCFSEQLLILGD